MEINKYLHIENRFLYNNTYFLVGGLSAEMTLKTVKYASARYYDNLPTSGPADGNTSVVVYGNPRDLTGGNHYQCRIGPYLLNGTYVASAAGVRCVTPAGMRAGDYPVELSLNGQQFTNGARDGGHTRRSP